MEEKLRKYLTETLEETVRLQPYPSSGLPFFLLDTYEFFVLELYGTHFIAMCTRPDIEFQPIAPPASIAKHISLCTEKTGLPCIYVADAITAYNRARLIKQRVQFVAPGNQMFLPYLGIDLREYMYKIPSRREGKHLKPAAQATLLFLVARLRGEITHVTELAAEMGYAKMTISRVIEELEAANLVKTEQRGRAKMIVLAGHPKEVWERALPMMQTPVKKSYRVVDQEIPGEHIKAGETALANFSDLNEPPHQVIAMTNDQWRAARLIAEPDGDLEIDIWRFDPRLLEIDHHAHPLTLLLQFQDHGDERVRKAVRQMMDNYKW